MKQHAVALWRDVSQPAEARAQALLDAMSLSEKIAQLGGFWDRPETEPSSDVVDEPVASGGDVAPMQHAFDQARRSFADATAHGLGQLTRVFGTAPVSPTAGVAALRAAQAQATSGSSFAIPALAHEECLTGFTAYGATVYPAAIAWGATFDPELIEEMAHAIGSDMRAVGIHQGLSPLLDVVRDYRWGRVEETIGEDPYLVGTLGTAYVRGLQSAGVVATLKHFAGYPASKAGRNHAPVSIGPREFTDVILAPFEMAVRDGGAGSVMNSYSDIDGLPAAASPELLTTILRDRWGFEGTVVSDYWAIAFLDLQHRVSPDRAASGAVALRAGVDVELPDADAYARLESLVASGEVDESLVDRSVLRVLTQKVGLGLLDPDWQVVPAATGDGSSIDLDPPGNRALARRVADESVVLLANCGILPLDRSSTARVAVIGPTADQSRSFLGCYSFPNHVMVHHSADDLGVPVPSLLDGLREALPLAELRYERGVPVLDRDSSGIAAAVRAAEDAELVVLAVGDLAALFGRGTSGEGCDVEDLRLPGLQDDLVEAVLATGTPVVLVAVTGRPYALGAYADRCAALVQAFMPGEEGGRAVAGVLTGDVNPSGHLPVGIPRSPGGQPYTYLAPPLGQHSDGISNLDPRPLFPFGYGLSYTEFDYEDIRVSSQEIATDGTVHVSVRVTNVGDRSGADVVQLYLSDPVASIVRPVRTLIGFARVELDAGESAVVDFAVHADRTAFTGIDLARIVEPGEVVLAVGHSSEDLPLAASVQLVGPVRRVDSPVLVTPVLVRAEAGVRG
ncbi:beta-glucosidase [Sanguibacter gelidistatuariae]|uniref:Exo-alpha-(1->6)-L-arabinopyranosidase n=1 Tax=Sanguibacter gelidistatuariae TaxID=1814289 RepID=A0A1G6VJ41_9MICO|nr:glycoside hydrolase family 3 N-terminal domain-containing protein [Sanguibacter gelidistatuariae]SDD53057.1 beta-glucosidase [Sanguibacter gelidistatuariae]